MRSAAEHFADPKAVANYAEGPPRSVPGFYSLQRMAGLLLAERVSEKGKVLVVGAGGGLEMRAFAEDYPGWTFEGIDPSEAMLELAKRTLGDYAGRARLHPGFVVQAPMGPFDGATCLLTMHFVGIEERRRMAAEIHRRLKPGSPLVVAHLSFPQDEGERDRWLGRYMAFLAASGIEIRNAEAARAAIDAQLTILSPEQDEEILREAGFRRVEMFYAGFAFRGWAAWT